MTDRSTAEDLARSIGLRYVTDEEPGISRVRRGSGFSYVDASGNVLGDRERNRIASLAIPPAWTDVWIAPDEKGHILATGTDDAGRKQYIYHPDWEDARDTLKFDRMVPFGRRLGDIRRQIETDLQRPNADSLRTTALAVAVLDRTLMRVGSPRYVEENDSYGLTTLTVDHVDASPAEELRLAFSGKGGAELEFALDDGRLQALVEECRRVAGPTLFSYTEGDDIGSVTATDVNEYVGSVAGEEFTAKDFRTWGASAIVLEAAAALDPDDFLQAVDVAAERLGNTRAVCRQSYVHPVIEESAGNGRLVEVWKASRTGTRLRRSESALNRLLGT